jgi:hypothetical protein
VAERLLDLGAFEPDGAVDAAVPDEDDVVVFGEPVRPVELDVGHPGPAFEEEDRVPQSAS